MVDVVRHSAQLLDIFVDCVNFILHILFDGCSGYLVIPFLLFIINIELLILPHDLSQILYNQCQLLLLFIHFLSNLIDDHGNFFQKFFLLLVEFLLLLWNIFQHFFSLRVASDPLLLLQLLLLLTNVFSSASQNLFSPRKNRQFVS